MMTLPEIRAALSDRNLKLVAERTGISYATIRNVQKGRVKDPLHSTVKALSDYLDERPWRSIGDVAATIVRDVEAKRK